MRLEKAGLAFGAFVGVFGLSAPASAVLHIWDGGGGSLVSWHDPDNWNTDTVPGNGDDVIIPGASVRLFVDAPDSIDNISLLESLNVGATLDTDGYRLSLEENVPTPDSGRLVIGAGSTMVVRDLRGGSPLIGFDVDNITVNGGRFLQDTGGYTQVDNELTLVNGGLVQGAGRIQLGTDGNVGRALNNNGVIRALGILSIDSDSNSPIDLDGSDGAGSVLAFDTISSGLHHLRIDAPLTDSFSGTMTIGDNGFIDFEQPWTNDFGTLTFLQVGTGAAPQLRGATLTNTFGSIVVSSGTAEFDAPLNMTGGTLVPAAGTTVFFNNTTTIGPGADFDMIAFGLTVNIDGSTVISQTAPIDLDGGNGDSVINVDDNASLQIDSEFNDSFDATLNLGQGATLTLNGSNHTFTALSTINKTETFVTVNIGGNTQIDSAIDLDGIGIGATGTNYNITDSSASLTINNDIELTGDSQFDGRIFNRGTLDVDVPGTDWSIGPGGVLELIDVGADPTVDGDTLINLGAISGSGRFITDVENAAGGTIRPGTATTAGTLRWEGADLTLTQGSVVEFNLGGLAAGTEYDQITGDGTLDLESLGVLSVTLIDGFKPAAGDSFTLFDFGATTLVGGANLANLPDLDEGLSWGFAHDGTLGMWLLQVLGGLTGDYNGDGFVSQADLDLVLLNWGDSVLPPEWIDTGQFDGVQVSQNELDGVLLNWGNGTPPNVSAIPEPSTLGVTALLGLAGLARRRRFIRVS